MSWLRILILYTALGFGANIAFAQHEVAANSLGDEMASLQFWENPKAVTQKPFSEPDGQMRQLSDYKGKIVLVNFWATWCAPCRKEMPLLNMLQQTLGGDDFQVVTIATGRNSPKKIAGFFEKAAITDLPQFIDIGNQMAADTGILGLPVTIILNRNNQEIARLRGEADWNSPAAHRIIQALIEAEEDK